MPNKTHATSKTNKFYLAQGLKPAYSAVNKHQLKTLVVKVPQDCETKMAILPTQQISPSPEISD